MIIILALNSSNASRNANFYLSIWDIVPMSNMAKFHIFRENLRNIECGGISYVFWPEFI